MTTLHLRKSITRSPLRRGCLLIALALCCFGLGPAPTFGVTPAPDGGYPNGNTAEGQNALFSLTTGYGNTANGYLALAFNTTGRDNTANGYGVLYSNTTGNENTANGSVALYSNTFGSENTATGYLALVNNTTGSYNAANGFKALYSNTTGVNNTANGYQALYFSTSGINNTANGVQALFSNTTGSSNTANGYKALYNNTSNGNTALGYLAGSALTTGTDNIDIGNAGVAGDAGIIRIGRSFINATYIAGIYGATASGGTAVYIDFSGQLGTATSSARFKQDIRSMDKASDVLLALRPVTFRYKHELDPEGIPQFGLVAEEVEKVNPALVVRDADGKPYSVRYEQINAMLLNEFLKEHSKVEEQATTIAQQRKDFQASITKLEATVAQQQEQIRAITASLKEQDSKIQAVNERLERTAPLQVVDSK